MLQHGSATLFFSFLFLSLTHCPFFLFFHDREDQKKQKRLGGTDILHRRSRFIPYKIRNDTGSPLWFMTATSTPSRCSYCFCSSVDWSYWGFLVLVVVRFFWEGGCNWLSITWYFQCSFTVFALRFRLHVDFFLVLLRFHVSHLVFFFFL